MQIILKDYAFFSLHVLYAPHLPDLFFGKKNLHMIFKFLQYH